METTINFLRCKFLWQQSKKKGVWNQKVISNQLTLSQLSNEITSHSQRRYELIQKKTQTQMNRRMRYNEQVLALQVLTHCVNIHHLVKEIVDNFFTGVRTVLLEKGNSVIKNVKWSRTWCNASFLVGKFQISLWLRLRQMFAQARWYIANQYNARQLHLRTLRCLHLHVRGCSRQQTLGQMVLADSFLRSFVRSNVAVQSITQKNSNNIIPTKRPKLAQ